MTAAWLTFAASVATLVVAVVYSFLAARQTRLLEALYREVNKATPE